MKSNNWDHVDNASVYPGLYEPPIWLNDVLDIEQNRNPHLIKAPVNIAELPDYYKIEIPFPGFNREDIFITIQGRLLTVSGIHKECADENNHSENRRHYDSECSQKRIELPEDVDPDFVTAECREGVLYIFIFKSFCATRPHAVRIVAY